MTNDKNKWYMVTLVGKDKPGIVAHITSALFQGNCNLGETSMMRLGGNFTIMMMVQFSGSKKDLNEVINTETDSLGLQLHIDKITATLHEHRVPDVRISVYGADRSGIVSKVTEILYEAGLNILDLESDVAGTAEAPVYIMHIEGEASKGFTALESAISIIKEEGIEAEMTEIETMIA